MALTRDQKKMQVTDLTKKMENASSIIFAQYLGLTVSNITKLRSDLRKEKAEMQVAKKTLIQIAAKDAKLPEIADGTLPGGVACIFSTTEPTAGASIAFRFAKNHPQIKLVGGIFDGKLLTAAEANDLATIPSRLQLLGIFAAMCSAPLVQFASACTSPLTGFARALSEIAKKKAIDIPAPVATPATTPTAAEAPVTAADTPAAPVAA